MRGIFMALQVTCKGLKEVGGQRMRLFVQLARLTCKAGVVPGGNSALGTQSLGCLGDKLPPGSSRQLLEQPCSQMTACMWLLWRREVPKLRLFQCLIWPVAFFPGDP